LEPARLYESPFTDHTPGPEAMFAETDVDDIVDILNTVKADAAPVDGVA
jgi:type I restriction enzyme R subunit